MPVLTNAGILLIKCVISSLWETSSNISRFASFSRITNKFRFIAKLFYHIMIISDTECTNTMYKSR